jgi:poly(3-hydroxybutyrate) depolymerase
MTMLYQLHELNHAALTPLRLASEVGQYALRNPFNPLSYTHGGRAVAAACELFEHFSRRHRKPTFGLKTVEIDGWTVPVTEEVLYATPFCRLLHFKREFDKAMPPQGHKNGRGKELGGGDPRLLIVAPLSGHFATLLRGTVAEMIKHHDVSITDWTDASEVPASVGPFDLDDYIELVIEFLHRLGPGTNVMAVCQPSVPVLAAVSLMSADKDPAVPPSMTLMGGPIDSRRNPTVPNKLASSHALHWFEHTVIHHVPGNYPGFMRKVYPGFIQLTGFMSMNLDRHVGAHIRLFHNLVKGDGDSADQHREFYNEYRAVMDLPAEYYLQTVTTVFQQHALPRGVMTSRGRRVEPKAITKTALLTIEGERDDISGVGQTEAAHDLCVGLPRAMRRHYLADKVGHYGVFNGRRWRENIAPIATKFIRQHSA